MHLNGRPKRASVHGKVEPTTRPQRPKSNAGIVIGISRLDSSRFAAKKPYKKWGTIVSPDARDALDLGSQRIRAGRWQHNIRPQEKPRDSITYRTLGENRPVESK
jgi:hypothetical protein